MGTTKVPFGIKKGTLVEVSEVISGLECNCICPGCKGLLVARKGASNAHHFAHHSSVDAAGCNSGAETAIHLMAKQIIEEEMKFSLPALELSRSGVDMTGREHTVMELAHASGCIIFDKVDIELTAGDYRPDIIGTVNDQLYFIEIAVTHFSDHEKIKKLQNKAAIAIEVDLSKLANTLPTKNELRSALVNSMDGRKWLSVSCYHEIMRRIELELKRKVEKANRRHLASCKPHAVAQAKAVEGQSSPEVRSAATNISSFYSKKDVSRRWFLCEACRDIFWKSWADAPANVMTTTCPHCAFNVIAQGPCAPLNEDEN